MAQIGKPVVEARWALNERVIAKVRLKAFTSEAC
jgi:hypothetical protein